MAEALAIISEIAGVLSLSSEVCRKISLFVLSTRVVNESNREIQKELLQLNRALASVHNVLLYHPEFSWDALRLDSHIGDCRLVLQELDIRNLHQSPTSQIQKQLIWTMKPLDGTESSLDLETLKGCKVLLEQWDSHIR